MSEANENKPQTPLPIKVALLIVASAFLAYGIYWAANSVIWANTLTQIIGLINSGQANFLGNQPSAHAALLLTQEFFSVANGFVQLAAAIFCLYAVVLYLKNNPAYLAKLRAAIILVAVFYLLLVPASIHHFVGVALGWPMVIIYVGLSYLIQALLISIPLLILSRKMKTPQNKTQILKWATIAAPLFVFALWFKYLFLWWDTLLPKGPLETGVWNIVGAANSVVTLLIAGAVSTFAAYALQRKRVFDVKLVGGALVLLGGFFLIFSLTALYVSGYASFWYLTDFWMLTVLILGLAVLVIKNRQPTIL